MYAISKPNNYGIFFSGLASTPTSIGIINWATGEKVSSIDIKGTTGKEIRADYDHKVKILRRAYKFQK
jgi:hypothetical protein